MSQRTPENTKIAVLGAGESGVGVALLAKKQGFDVFVSDKGKIKASYKQELLTHGIPNEEGRHTEARLREASEIVKSPGIPDQIPLIRELRQAGKPVISEIEFASRYTEAMLIGITGSNGKTTTTRLTYHLLQSGGRDAGMAGNVGNSFARLLAEEEPKEVYVLELSSFQLDGIRDFRPHLSMILNITPDHLDRYEYRMENYIRSKFEIVRNQKTEDLFLYNGEDENIRQYMAGKTFLPECEALTGRQIEGTALNVDHEVFELRNPALRGRHNAMNALFAVTACRYLGVADADIRRGLDDFVNVPHRLEKVAEMNGVTFYNDSKATNVDAAYYALGAMEGSVIWIAGGQDKGNDYGRLEPLVREKVKAVVCLGVDNEKIVRVFDGIVDTIVETRSAEEAVREAARLADPGDAVLLSPACASFDLFKNYEDRGDQFKAAVKKLQKGEILF
jgi:UDP-N-acetylmuramoylalanine--D-glutamate ligase